MTDDERAPAAKRDFLNIWRNIIILFVLGGSAFIAVISLLYFMHDNRNYRSRLQTLRLYIWTARRRSRFAFDCPSHSRCFRTDVCRVLRLEIPRGSQRDHHVDHCFFAIAYAIERTWPLEYTPPPSLYGTTPPPAPQKQ